MLCDARFDDVDAIDEDWAHGPDILRGGIAVVDGGDDVVGGVFDGPSAASLAVDVVDCLYEVLEAVIFECQCRLGGVCESE